MLRDRLKAARKAKGYTLAEAAELAGLSESSISKIEGGTRACSQLTLETLARVYGTTPAALLGPEGQQDAGRTTLLRIWDALDDSGREQLLRIAETFLPQGSPVRQELREMPQALPDGTVRAPTPNERRLLEALRTEAPHHNWCFGHRVATSSEDWILAPVASPDRLLSVEIMRAFPSAADRRAVEDRRRALARAGWRLVVLTPAEIHRELPRAVEEVLSVASA